MLISGSSLIGLVVEAEDGKIGHVSDLLFDDRTWKARWLVVDISHWLTGRKVLVHPSAVGEPDFGSMQIRVQLTKQQVKDSPDIAQDLPVSRQMQASLYGYWTADPFWGGDNYFGAPAGGMGWPLGHTQSNDARKLPHADRARSDPGFDIDDGDPDLRSLVAVTGYHLEATDGPIGHIETLMMDTETWGIRYMAVDTRNWWPGEHVLVSPYAVTTINWLDRQVSVNISRPRSNPARHGVRPTSSNGPMRSGCMVTTTGRVTAGSGRRALP